MKKTLAGGATALVFASLLAAVAGCGGSGTALTGATPTPPPPTNDCTNPPGVAGIRLTFPIPDDTSVPGSTDLTAPNNQGFVFAVLPTDPNSPVPMPTDWYAYGISTLKGTTKPASIGFLRTPSPGTASATPSPLPTPSSPPIANSVVEIANFGVLTPSHWVIRVSSKTCGQGLYAGEFTAVDDTSPTPSPTPTASPT